MNSPEPDIDSLVDALRSDLPQGEQAARLRSRLTAAGIIAGGVVAPGTAAGAGASVLSGAAGKVSVVSKSLLSLGGSKIGVAAVVVAASASLPVASYLASGPGDASEPAPAPVAPAAAPAADRALLAATPDAPLPAPAEPVPAVTAPEPAERPNAAPPAARAPSPAVAAPVATESPREASKAAAVAAFPSLEKRAPESTLREETELMDRALSALRAGDTASARELLRAHAARFPNGALVRERERALERLKHAEMNR